MKRHKKVSRKHINSLPKLRAPAGYVYVIQDVDISRQYKIGKTNNPSRRLLSEFQVQLPFRYEVILVKQANNALAAENYLHGMYREKRGMGEWFVLSETQLSAIDAWDANRIIPSTPKKKNRKSARRKSAIKDVGWSETEWADAETTEIDGTDDYSWDLDETEEDLWETEKSDTFLSEGDVEDTIMYENLAGKNLAGIILERSDLSDRDLSFANLWGANLSYTEFMNSDLTAVDLTDADLKGANLRGTNMMNCNLTGADLTNADLSSACLTGAKFDWSTRLPDAKFWSPETDMRRFTG